MILQFMVYAYTVAVVILLAVFVIVASYLWVSGKSAPYRAPGGWRSLLIGPSDVGNHHTHPKEPCASFLRAIANRPCK